MKQRIYLDTSVFGALTDPGPDYRIASTEHLFRQIKAGLITGVVSNVLYEELSRAPQGIGTMLERHAEELLLIIETSESEKLTEAYLQQGVFSRGNLNDARHIAVAVVNGIQTIVSWNFKHMVNLARKRRVNSVNLIHGFPIVEIISPQEVEYGFEGDTG